MPRVLIGGGYGVVGSWIARHLRAAGHDLELVLGGRSPSAGAALAKEVDASLVMIDTSVVGAGLDETGPVDLVISALQDHDDNLLNAALRSGAAFLGIVRQCSNLGPTAMAVSVLARRPVLMSGHWQAGAMSLATLAAARDFAQIDRIELGALFDFADQAGPMSMSDSGGFFTKALMRRGGVWEQVDPGENTREVHRHGLASFTAQPMGVLDVAGLWATTGARELRFDLGVGSSIGTATGERASHDIHIDIWGKDAQGQAAARRILLSDPHGQAHLTALGAFIGAERLLGLDGAEPPLAGLHFPEGAIDPEQAVARLRAFGVRLEEQSIPAADLR